MPREGYFFQKRIYLYWILVFYLPLVYYTAIAEAGIIIFDGEENIEEFSDSELPFAQPIKKYGIEGAIVSADPVDACTPIAGPPDINATLHWFVLIAGNFCDYHTKLVNSANAGYAAAVIYSLRGRNDGPFARRYDFISNMSAVTIRTSSGLIIKDNYLYTIDPSYRMYIFRNNAFNIITFVLLFAIVAGIFMVVMLAFLIVRFVHQAHTSYETRLSTQHLNQLQTSRFQKGDPYETCAICLEDYKAREKLRILPCMHGYHASCIDPWLTKSRRICPVCKQRVVLAHEISDIESDDEIRSETAPLLNNYNRSASNTYRAVSGNANISSHGSQHNIISETPMASSSHN